MKPKILILYTGGTFGMDFKEKSDPARSTLAIPNLSPQVLKTRFLQQVPEIKKIANCSVQILCNRDSAHIGSEEWVALASTIQDNWDAYDGFIILHGTDTLAYSASALSYLLRPCKKPIVMTGAQRPLSAIRTDARNNLISAVEIVAHGPRPLLQQITVFFENQLFQGNKIRKKSSVDFTAFESPHQLPLATVGTSIRYSNLVDKTKRSLLRLNSTFSNRVLVLQVTPEFPSETLSSEFLDQIDALVLIVFLSGTAPTHQAAFNDFLNRARSKKIPIIITTEGNSPQSISPPLSPQYDAGSALHKTGCYWAGEMTPESAFVKASLLIAQPNGKAQFQNLWKLNLAGETSTL